MGRPRLPKEFHELTGTIKHNPEQKKFGSSKGIAFPRGTIVPPPKHFTQKSKEAWNRVVVTLINLQVLTDLDLPKLDGMFEHYDSWVRIDTEIKELQKNKDMFRDPKLFSYFNSLKKSRLKDWEAFSKEAQAFGMSPSDRTKLQLPEQDNQGDLLELLDN
jgi:P27 family predicted phage terminase small subunit